MPKMGSERKAISMTKSGLWTTPYPHPQKRSDKIKQFCCEHCPHPNKPCNGDCPEIKEFTQNIRKRRAERKED